MRHRYVWFYNRASTIVVLITLIVATDACTGERR